MVDVSAPVSGLTVFFLSLIMSSASGLGSLPFFFFKELSPWAGGTQDLVLV